MRNAEHSGPVSRPAPHRAAGALLALVVFGACPAQAATMLICRGVNLAEPMMAPLTIPAGILFKDDGRADDPLRAFTNDKWQLKLETINATVIPPLDQCGRVLVRITSDSSTRSVAASDNRLFVFAGNANILDENPVPEEVMILRGRVLDSVP